jgi:hypothetical protein
VVKKTDLKEKYYLLRAAKKDLLLNNTAFLDDGCQLCRIRIMIMITDELLDEALVVLVVDSCNITSTLAALKVDCPSFGTA